MTTLAENGSVFVTAWEPEWVSQTLSEELRRLGPRPNGYSVEDYFALDGAYQLEFVDGCLQILPMPTALHQNPIFWLLKFFEHALAEFDPNARMQFAVFKVKLNESRFREPDVCLMRGRNVSRTYPTHWDGCDLAIEVVSPSNADHDWTTKRRDYAEAGVPEYWVVDSQASTVTQFMLPPDRLEYPEGVTTGKGDLLTCRVLPGIEVDVGAMFAEAQAQSR